MRAFKYVVIGGGMAGQRGCAGIRKEDADGSIALICAENHIPYERPPLSKGYVTGKSALDSVFLKPADYYSDNGIELFLGATATKLQPEAHTVTLDDGQVLGYDKLLIATGAVAVVLPLPGADKDNVFTLRSIEDADGIRQAANAGSNAVVLGGSFVGCEVAASLSQMGLAVTMVFPEDRLLQRVASEALSAHLQAKFADAGIRVVSGAKPIEMRGETRVTQVVLDNGQTLPADLVVMGVGVRLNTKLAQDAGLEMGERGAIVVDRNLRTSAADIYAAGDIAAWPSKHYDRTLRVEHWDVARTQGYRAGRNMAVADKPYITLPYFFSDMLDLSFEVWGSLASWDQTVQRGTLASGKFALLYADKGRLTGALAAGLPRADTDALKAMVVARPDFAQVAAAFQDAATDLAALVDSIGQAKQASDT